MPRIINLEPKSIRDWEAAIASRPEIEFSQMFLKKGNVCGVDGWIKANSRQYKVKWLFDGKCYYNGKHVRQYDITFNQ